MVRKKRGEMQPGDLSKNTPKLLDLFGDEIMGQNFIGYEILILTDDCMMDIGPFFTRVPIDEKRVTKEIRVTLTQEGISEYNYTRIEEIVLVATDGNELQIFDLEPEDLWPAEFNISKKTLFESKGGDKN